MNHTEAGKYWNEHGLGRRLALLANGALASAASHCYNHAMRSPMLPKDHQAAVQRALALGRSGDPTALPELVALLRLPSHEIQRLAASAIGKLISVHPRDLPGLDGLLTAKLRQYGWLA